LRPVSCWWVSSTRFRRHRLEPTLWGAPGSVSVRRGVPRFRRLHRGARGRRLDRLGRGAVPGARSAATARTARA
jgi:hypothetical protein